MADRSRVGTSKRPTRQTASDKGRPRRCTWDEVLVAAELLMRKQGYKSLSMRALADELGISHPSLYTYFNHIEEVEVAVLQAVASRIPTPAAKTAAQLRTQLLDFVSVAHEYALNHQGLIESPVGSPAWVVLTDKSLQWLKVIAHYTGDPRRAEIAYSALISVAKYTADLERINGANVRELTNAAVQKHFGIRRTSAKESHLSIVVASLVDSLLPELSARRTSRSSAVPPETN